MSYEIIDFHTHPFLSAEQNICSHQEYIDMTPEYTLSLMRSLGVSRFCGSVISNTRRPNPASWQALATDNQIALDLQARYNGAYIAGFHVHPAFVKESCAEIERQAALGTRLIGELVPYHDHWEDYGCKEFDTILDCAQAHNMVISVHTMNEDAMDNMVRKHPRAVIVAAHPNEYDSFMRHMARMKMSENYYLDLSGYGMFRHGMLRHAIAEYGAERILYGSDYPTCNPAMYIGGVLLDDLVTDDEKKLIFAGNAKRLLGL